MSQGGGGLKSAEKVSCIIEWPLSSNKTKIFVLLVHVLSEKAVLVI